MSRVTRAVVPLLLVAGCAAVTPAPDTARIRPDAFGNNADPDVGAVNLASWAYADSGRLRNDPADAARAAAAVDYLAGALSTNPRWAFMSPLTKMEMLQARIEVRQTLGIDLSAPSTEVVRRLLYVGDAMEDGNPVAAQTALQPPVFTKSPAETMAVLTATPFLRETNIATIHAAGQVQPGGSGNSFEH